MISNCGVILTGEETVFEHSYLGIIKWNCEWKGLDGGTYSSTISLGAYKGKILIK